MGGEGVERRAGACVARGMHCRRCQGQGATAVGIGCCLPKKMPVMSDVGRCPRSTGRQVPPLLLPLLVAMAATIRACLAAIFATPETIAGCDSVDSEFGALKKVYFKGVLSAHPDKGGDPAAFRAIHEAWEVLRALYDAGRVHVSGFAFYFKGEGAAQRAEPARASFSGAARPASYSWYEAAAAEPVPAYRAEAARSNRSTCAAEPKKEGQKAPASCKHGAVPGIALGELRCGSMDPESGTYGRWKHLVRAGNGGGEGGRRAAPRLAPPPPAHPPHTHTLHALHAHPPPPTPPAALLARARLRVAGPARLGRVQGPRGL